MLIQRVKQTAPLKIQKAPCRAKRNGRERGSRALQLTGFFIGLLISRVQPSTYTLETSAGLQERKAIAFSCMHGKSQYLYCSKISLTISLQLKPHHRALSKGRKRSSL